MRFDQPIEPYHEYDELKDNPYLIPSNVKAPSSHSFPELTPENRQYNKLKNYEYDYVLPRNERVPSFPLVTKLKPENKKQTLQRNNKLISVTIIIGVTIVLSTAIGFYFMSK